MIGNYGQKLKDPRSDPDQDDLPKWFVYYKQRESMDCHRRLKNVEQQILGDFIHQHPPFSENYACRRRINYTIINY
jgi:hypothetical protein